MGIREGEGQVSSLRLLSRGSVDGASAVDTAWVEVTSPIREQRQPSAPGVVLAIAEARERYRTGGPARVSIDLGSLGPYGSGDASLASEIEESVDRSWDE